jgi:hypothetical protein
MVRDIWSGALNQGLVEEVLEEQAQERFRVLVRLHSSSPNRAGNDAAIKTAPISSDAVSQLNRIPRWVTQRAR